MTAPLAEIAARKLAPEITGFEYDMLLDEQKAAIRARVQPVLDACGAEEMLAALRDLLEDTQHRDHRCGDTQENCPVLRARAVLGCLINTTEIAEAEQAGRVGGGMSNTGGDGS